ncbi:unnamed protein product [Rotaria sp. Silwood1]|nr:unnamed protein product [Rotaria sp. Silwood1]CAF3562160.1 unnamed protein product [Rotaria sp. Silwood1]CAF4610382.1 unnamed protein product [Rotaria sp. Silwood1]CAF4859631.1 unnamed protein product [Rotaria sp. Silwood1]
MKFSRISPTNQTRITHLSESDLQSVYSANNVSYQSPSILNLSRISSAPYRPRVNRIRRTSRGSTRHGSNLKHENAKDMKFPRTHSASHYRRTRRISHLDLPSINSCMRIDTRTDKVQVQRAVRRLLQRAVLHRLLRALVHQLLRALVRQRAQPREAQLQAHQVNDVSVTLTTAPSIQLLNNPSFESSTTIPNGWVVWCDYTCSAGGGAAVTWGTNCYLSTANCFLVDCPDTGSGAIVYLGQSFPATVGSTYRIGFRLRMAFGGGSFSQTQFRVFIR